MNSIYIFRQNYTMAYKIGVSESVGDRLSNLQSANPYKLIKVFSIQIPKAYEVEKYIHALYNDFNLRGEWFELNPFQVISIVKELEALKEKSNMIMEVFKTFKTSDKFQSLSRKLQEGREQRAAKAKRNAEQAKRLRSEGLSLQKIADQLGVSKSAVHRYLNPQKK